MSFQSNQLKQLLYSPRQEEEDANLSQEHSSFHNYNYDQIDDCEQGYIQSHNDNQRSNDNYDFFHCNGHSVQFSQNFSQNSMMMASSRPEEDPKDYKIDSDKKYKRFLENKREEQVQFNEVLDRQLSNVKQQLQKSRFEVSKLQSSLKGCELRIAKKSEQIAGMELIVSQKQQQIEKLQQQKAQILQCLEKRDGIFRELQEESKKVFNQSLVKDKKIEELTKLVDDLTQQIDSLHKGLSVYNQSDRKLFDFKGYSHEQLTVSKKSTNNDKQQKELQKIKKEKNLLQIQLSALRQKFQDRENRYRQFQEENRKKSAVRDRKIQENEQKLSELKDENLKMKALNESNIQKINNSLNAKMKEINSLTEKVGEGEKRVKSLLQETKRKDEKIRDLNMQILQKNKYLNQKQKEIDDLKIKQEFDHHLVTEKDKEIQKLLGSKKQLELQIDGDREKREKQQKNQRLDKTQKLKREKEQEKQKKELETLRKNLDTSEKDKQQASANLKDLKRKYEEVNKKIQSLRSSNSQLQSQIKDKQMEILQLKQDRQKTIRELTDTKKKIESIPELKNKIIILESRLKQNESMLRESSDLTESINLHDKIQALECRLQEKQKEVSKLKTMLTNHSVIGDVQQQQDCDYLIQIEERERCIQSLEAQLHAKNDTIDKLTRELEFKDSTLDFTHKILVNSEKAKIELQQQKKMLEELLQNPNKQILFYEQKVGVLQGKVKDLERRLRDREEGERQKDEYKFENRQLQKRIKELNDALLSKQRKITPETMSQEDTVVFLIKTIRKVNRSAQLLRLLSKNQQFYEVFSRMQRQFIR